MNLSRLIKQNIEQAEENSEYILNHDFNTKLDDGDIEGYELILKKPNGEELTLSPLSAALFVTDLPTYRQLVREDLDLSKQEILNYEAFPSNEHAYDRLLTTLKRQATIIPFIGAGFSVGAGCPTWADYIVKQAEKVGMDPVEAMQRLEAGEHARMMDIIIDAITLSVFQRDFRSEFEGGKITPSLSPATELLDLFEGSAITTNFDRVLEESHKESRPFDEKVVGNDDTGRFLKSIFRGEKYLLKLHGNIDEARDRVLTQTEYDRCYGDGDIQLELPIPRTLTKVFGSYTVLFLGCSLIGDRYLDILRHTYEQGNDFMPEHFAILCAPGDDDQLAARDSFLAEHGITPIWFSEGDWDRPAEILQLLKRER
jgi:hypothetical protein